MLPPGHIAAGFLTAKALLKVLHPQLSTVRQNQLLLWGMFFGFAPDLDYFYVFFREHAFTVKDMGRNNHRRFITHAPLLWLIAGLLIYFFSADVYYKFIGLLLWLGSWSHFMLDSIEDGVMWLWPISLKRYALKFPSIIKVDNNNFFGYWWKFIGQYIKSRVTFYFEVLIIITAAAVFLHH